MRKVLWLGLILFSANCAVQAQSSTVRRRAAAPALVLTPQEGQGILDAAQEDDSTADGKPDCSHLTYNVYSRAGYPYPYARSIDLYAGIKDFVRVRRPQPGDLIVWRGHVGIVVDARRHTFYSSLRSGLRTDFYDVPVWKTRGPARFYRYAVTLPVTSASAAYSLSISRRNAAPFYTRPTLAEFPDNLPDATQSSSGNFGSATSAARRNTN